MALTQNDVQMWMHLDSHGLIPPTPSVLEIGQANWYGDSDPPPGCEDDDPYVVARKWYRQILRYREIIAIDWDGPDAVRRDLNKPIDFVGSFDIVINSGTTEHVFDQRQVLKTIHDACTVGGLMVHCVPWQGWLDHGLYSYQPGFFSDLAEANHYEPVYSVKAGIRDVMLYVALGKTEDAPFRVPIQGKYRKGTCD